MKPCCELASGRRRVRLSRSTLAMRNSNRGRKGGGQKGEAWRRPILTAASSRANRRQSDRTPAFFLVSGKVVDFQICTEYTSMSPTLGQVAEEMTQIISGLVYWNLVWPVLSFMHQSVAVLAYRMCVMPLRLGYSTPCGQSVEQIGHFRLSSPFCLPILSCSSLKFRE